MKRPRPTAGGPIREIVSKVRLNPAAQRQAGFDNVYRERYLLTLRCGHHVIRQLYYDQPTARCGHCLEEAEEDIRRRERDARLRREEQGIVTSPSTRLRRQRERYERGAMDAKAEEYLGARVKGLARDYDTVLEQLTLGLDPSQLEEGDRFGLDVAMLVFPVIYQGNGNVRFAEPAPGHATPPAMLLHPAMQGEPRQAGGLVRMFEGAFAGMLASLTARFPELFGLPAKDAPAE